MMTLSDQAFKSKEIDDGIALCMPFKGGELEMVFVTPDDGK